MLLLSTAYFPPVSYFAAIAKDFALSPDGATSSVVHIEAHEHYQKQSYRNRCVIMSSQGKINLNVPVIHDNTLHGPITDVRIDYSTPWVKQTRTAIASAYGMSAYFDYYKDDLFAILDSKPQTLWELNSRILEFFLKKTGICASVSPTTEYEASPQGCLDLREKIHPKRSNTILEDLGLKKPYFQVFSGKYGFCSDLSIMDLLFNEGPDSIIFLKRL